MLLRDDIIRESYDLNKNKSFYEFHSMTVKYAYE